MKFLARLMVVFCASRALCACPNEGQHLKKTRAQWLVRSLHEQLEQAVATGSDCNHARQRIAKEMDTRDPWGNAVIFDCGNLAAVASAGPDAIPGTDDDIRAP